MKQKIFAVIAAVLMTVCAAGTALAANTPTPGMTPTPAPTATTDPNSGVWIDGTYIEEGMNNAYMNGYTPTVSGGTAHVVLPLTGSPNIDGTVYCTLGLGGDAGPFISSNYDNIPVAQKFAGTNFFVARFDLPLKADRVNGTYPLTITVKYTDNIAGAKVEGYANFSVNVRITDGKADASASPSAGAISQPKVIMSKYVVEPDPAYAGTAFHVTVTLENTSENHGVRNLTATYKSQTTDLIPEDGTNTAFIKSIDPGKSAQFSFQMEARADAKAGPQKIDVAIEYEDTQMTKYTGAGEITVQVRQKIRLEHDDPKFPNTVYQGDSVSNTLNLYNKGKNMLYNVTVFLELPGLTPDSSAFLGNMDSGVAKSADMYANVDMAEVGPASGRYLVTYEDEYGESYEMEIPLETMIQEQMPMDEGMYPEEPAEPEQAGLPWWVWLVVAGAGAGIVGGVLAKKKKEKRERELMEEMDDDDLS